MNFQQGVLLFILFLQLIPYPQNKVKANKLLPINDVIAEEGISRSSLEWIKKNNFRDLLIEFNTYDTVQKDLMSLNRSMPDAHYLGMEKDEFTLLKKYEENIYSLLGNMPIIENRLIKFTYLKGKVPIRFGRKDKDIVLLLYGIVSNNNFNTLRLTERQRAAKIISSVIMPSIKNIIDNIENTEIKYIGLQVVYESQDFSDDNSLAPESVTFLSSVKLCKSFIKGGITDEEFINKSEVYSSDRNMEEKMIKKISINLE